MTALEIERLVRFLPENTAYLNHLPRVMSCAQSSRSVEVSLHAYAQQDPSIGWHYVRACISDDVPVPAEVLQPWIRRAHRFETQDVEDEEMRAVVSLEHPKRSHLKNLVRALLVIPSVTWEDMVAMTRLKKAVLQGYDALFFNIRDRLNDPAYLASIVYPEGWPVEFQLDYLSREDIGALMLRAAYNHGLQPLLNVAGIRSALTQGNQPDDVARSVELMIMNNASSLAQLGSLNQSFAPGILHAKHLMAAAKQGGQGDVAVQDDVTALSMGRSVIQEVLTINRASVDRRLAAQKHFLSEMEQSRRRKKAAAPAIPI